MIISGHSHSYSRGFLARHLSSQYTSPSLSSSSALEPSLIQASREIQSTQSKTKISGTIHTVIGGGGGALDLVKVEDWGFYEKSLNGEFFWVSMNFESGSESEWKDGMKIGGEEVRTYRFGDCPITERKKAKWDRIWWSVIGLKGNSLDRMMIEVESCD
jgi:hypothetical protein